MKVGDWIMHLDSGEIGRVVSLPAGNNYPREEEVYFVQWDNGDCGWIWESEIIKLKKKNK